MAFAEFNRTPVGRWLLCGPAAVRLKAWRADKTDSVLAQRMAGTAYVIRVASAIVVYLTQVALARWMGSFEFGIYVYVWTWVLLVGDIIHLGLPLAAQRFIPEYGAAQAHDRLRGFIVGAQRMGFGCAVAAMLLGVALVRWFEPWFDSQQVVPLYLACLALPFFTLSVLLDGIARAYNWINLGLTPHFLCRPIVILALMAAAHLAGFPATATTAMVAVVIATWSMAIVQLVLINRRLAKIVEAGPRRYELKTWLTTSIPIVMVWGFYTLLTYTDIIVLQQFCRPEDVALYYAVARTLLLVAFVYFAVAAAVGHRFAAYHLAGDRQGLAELVASAVRWTFWPSLIATVIILALGRPLLWLFGPTFVDGYPLMFVLAIGPLARASVGPAERLLNMLGEQRICAVVYALAFLINLVGCIALAPHFGVAGAAIAITAAVVFESIALFVVTKRRLGFHIFIWGQKRT